MTQIVSRLVSLATLTGMRISRLAAPERSAWVLSLLLLGCSGGGAKDGGSDGPAVTGQWVLAASGLPAEQVEALAVDPSNPMTVYAGFLDATMGVGAGVGGGIYRTSNGGTSWSAANDGVVVPGVVASGPPAIFSLSIDKLQPQTLYAGGDYGLWKSIDGGASWSSFGGVADGGDQAPDLNASQTVVAVDPNNSKHVYVGAHFGLYVTSDAGSTWNNLLPGPPVNAGEIAFDPVHAGTVYARADGNYERITNDTQVTGLDTAQMTGNSGVVDPTGALYLYAAETTSTTIEEVLVSTDEGSTWTHADSGLSGALSTLPSLSFAANPPVAGALYAVLQQPQSTNASAPPLGRLFRFQNGSWSDVTGTLPPQICIVATGTSDPETIYVGTTDGRVFRSNGG